MRRELRQCPVMLTGDSDRIHRKAIVHAPPERPYLSATSRASKCEGIDRGRPKPINLNVKDKLKLQGRCDISTILIILVLILLLGGGGYYGPSRYGGTRLGGVLGLVLVVAVVVWLVGGLHMG